MPAVPKPPELLQGTLEVMVLRTLERGPAHGYGVARAIERASGGELTIEEGSLYPALHRLVRRGDLVGEWTVTEQNRRARVYRLTPQGRSRLIDQVSLWEQMSAAVTRVLQGGAAPDPGERPA
jgi:PadR family transcriptional regulator, regulatory protein PadR